MMKMNKTKDMQPMNDSPTLVLKEEAAIGTKSVKKSKW